MSYLSETEFQKKMKKIKLNNFSKERKAKLREEKKKYSIRLENKIETSKVLAIYLFILLNVVLIYSLVAMWHFGDLSYLGVLITDVAAQIVTYAIYCMKAFKAKKESEKMAFEREKFEVEYGIPEDTEEFEDASMNEEDVSDGQ